MEDADFRIDMAKYLDFLDDPPPISTLPHHQTEPPEQTAEEITKQNNGSPQPNQPIDLQTNQQPPFLQSTTYPIFITTQNQGQCTMFQQNNPVSAENISWTTSHRIVKMERHNVRQDRSPALFAKKLTKTRCSGIIGQ